MGEGAWNGEAMGMERNVDQDWEVCRFPDRLTHYQSLILYGSS